MYVCMCVCECVWNDDAVPRLQVYCQMGRASTVDHGGERDITTSEER